MKGTERRFASNLFSVYCSMIEFINDLRLPRITCLLCVCFQSMCMVLQQMISLPHLVPLLQLLQNLGIVSLVHQDQNSSVQVTLWVIQTEADGGRVVYLVIASQILIVLLLTPVVATVTVLYTWVRYEQQPSTAALEEHSLMRLYRYAALLFQYCLMPVLTPLCVMIVQEQRGSTAASLSIVSLVLIPLTYYFIEYHQLELEPQLADAEQDSYQLIRRNFPNNLLDGLLVYAHGIALVCVPFDYCILVAIAIFFSRLVCSYYVPFYEGKLKRLHTFLQTTAIVLLVAMQVCRMQGEVVMFVVIAGMLVGGLHRVLFKTGNMDYWRVAEQAASKIQECKVKLIREQTFGCVFRELLFIERQAPTYRELLLVQALKKKCIKLECASRGGAKIINTECLLRYERKMLVIINNFFVMSDHSISILKFMQQREPKAEVFIEQISKVVELIAQTKEYLNDMLKVNRSPITIELATLLSKGILNDDEYYRSVLDMGRQQIQSITQKKERKKLFNQHSGVVFLSLLEDVGKITRASKNIKQVLGYTPADLMGLSVNELMPFSIRPYHNEVLLNFLRKYSKKIFKSDPYIKFLAYNKQFHLQEVVINYYFNMNDFENFELSGLFRQVRTNCSVVLCDHFGNLEGWTSDVGQALKFDNYNQMDCRSYNMMVLLPALIKCQPTATQRNFFVETLLFVPKDMKSSSLRLMESFNKKSVTEALMVEKQLAVFQQMIAADEFSEVKMVQLQLEFLSFLGGNVKFRKLNIKRVEQIRNSAWILETIRNSEHNTERPSEQKIKEINSVADIGNASYPAKDMNNSMMQSFDSAKLVSKVRFTPDYVFASKDTMPPLFGITDIELTGEVDLRSTRGGPNKLLTAEQLDVSSKEEQQSNPDTVGMTTTKNKPSSNFNPSLHRSRFHTIFYPLTLFYLVLVLYDTIAIQTFDQNVNQQCSSVRNINTAFMIYVKSSFNANLTYVREFENGALLEVPHLTPHSVQYQIGSQITNMSSSYLFNNQIPSMLARLALDNDYTELTNNFYNVVGYFDNEIQHDRQEWLDEVASLRFSCNIRFAFIVVESAVYVIYLVYCYHHSKTQNKLVEAFFKFEKSDLDAKVEHLRECMVELELKCQECFLSQQLPNIMKNNHLSNVSLTRSIDPNPSKLTLTEGKSSRQSSKEYKISFDVTNEREQKIVKRKLLVLVLYVSLFAVAQISFLILYGIMSRSLIQVYQAVPQDINQASKLIVEPNIRIASIFRTVPQNVLDKYSQNLPALLAQPSESVPNLFPLLQTTPCGNCSYLYPLLSTNFISFYSSFNQLVKDALTAVANRRTIPFNTTELFYALDIVTGKIREALVARQVPLLLPTISIYVASLVIFVIAGYNNQKMMEHSRERLEHFLKYFNQETVMKNKHLSNTVKISI